MAEFVQDAAALLLVPPAGAELLLLLDPSLAHPASPALAVSTAIVASAATLICPIPALLIITYKDQENYYPERPGAHPAPSGTPSGVPFIGVDVPLVRFLHARCAIDSVAGNT